MTNHLAVVPVKGLAESKTRISKFLYPEDRKILVKALLEDVLTAVVHADIFSSIIVISPDESIANETQRHETVFVKQNGSGLNLAAEQAIRIALKQDAQTVTLILADIPLAEPRDFVELFKLGSQEPKLVMAPSLKGGTNVMTISPPGALHPAYGRWSYAKHLRAAQKKKLNAYSLSNPRVSFDIDTINDLTELRRLDPTGRTTAGRAAHEMGRLPSLVKAGIARKN